MRVGVARAAHERDRRDERPVARGAARSPPRRARSGPSSPSRRGTGRRARAAAASTSVAFVATMHEVELGQLAGSAIAATCAVKSCRPETRSPSLVRARCACSSPPREHATSATLARWPASRLPITPAPTTQTAHANLARRYRRYGPGRSPSRRPGASDSGGEFAPVAVQLLAVATRGGRKLSAGELLFEVGRCLGHAAPRSAPTSRCRAHRSGSSRTPRRPVHVLQHALRVVRYRDPEVLPQRAFQTAGRSARRRSLDQLRSSSKRRMMWRP